MSDDNDNDISVPDLVKDEVRYYLGLIASMSLKELGQVTFIVGSDNNIRMANPLFVYLDSEALTEEDEERKELEWVRPVLGSGRPQVVAWKDGVLWEVNFKDED